MRDIFIPASVFGTAPSTQSRFAEVIRAAGAEGIEIRRELFPPGSLPLAECREANRRSGLRCVYSVPMELWVRDGRLNEEQLVRTLEETAILQPDMLKVSLGRCGAAPDLPAEIAEEETPCPEREGLGRLSRLLEKYREVAGPLTLLVENDQTPHGGRAGRLKAFFEAACRFGLEDVRMTFDTGNWLYAGEEPVRAARALAPYVAYIHCKHVVFTGDGPLTVPLPAGEDALWRKLLGMLPEEAPRAIEFGLPAGEELGTYIRMLREDDPRAAVSWKR